MFEVGRICIKTAGRDSNQVCVIIDVLEGRYVLVDGQTRRKKVNIAHIEPTSKTVDIKKNATTESVVKALESAGFSVDKKGKARTAAARVKKVKVKHEKKVVEAKVKDVDAAPKKKHNKAEKVAHKPKAEKKAAKKE